MSSPVPVSPSQSTPGGPPTNQDPRPGTPQEDTMTLNDQRIRIVRKSLPFPFLPCQTQGTAAHKAFFVFSYPAPATRPHHLNLNPKIIPWATRYDTWLWKSKMTYHPLHLLIRFLCISPFFPPSDFPTHGWRVMFIAHSLRLKGRDA